MVKQCDELENESQRVYHAFDGYDNASKIGKRVVMVGGGLVGCETGLHLAKIGYKVTVVEMLDSLASESFGMYVKL